MLSRNDWMELELTKQRHRLRYIDTVLSGGVHCPFPPRRVFIEPTNVCNLNCVHCVHDGKMTRPKGFMDMALFRKIMDDIKGWNRSTELCLFQQGEPLLHREIAEMARLAGTHYDFFTKLNTNGVALTRELSAQLIANGLDYLVFSLDAITPQTYLRVKRRDHFHKVMDNILDYMEIWGDLDIGRERNYFACDINILEEEANRHEIPVFREMLERLPVGHVSVYQLHNYMGAVEEANAKVDTGGRPHAHWPCCNSPWDVVGIRWNGDVVACIYDYDSRYVIGNVGDAPLEAIWNGERMTAFRRALLERRFDVVEARGPMCSECSILWMPEYQLPTDYYAEIRRMERYLCDAVDRVGNRWPRTEKLLERHRYLKEHRAAWRAELDALGSAPGPESGRG
ncbi:radical SAM/SPASM domain-containing protein [Desulfocurvus sp.]|uniref:radical SAM protein n=1 Tax=Desulfocurvus sp. TaxID=2871698 RepID=UPI0025BAC1B5|nr:radical SAM/SPASM domain-containing protein [Desulfocurvus sp.]MCK9238821.1 radical SAM protein [Desulfocurvus sp.]